MTKQPRIELLGLNLEELTELVSEFAQPAFRARQLFAAIYRQRTGRLEDISTLPKAFRRELGSSHCIGRPEIERLFESRDGTIRYLLRLSDGELVETVWMPAGDGGENGDTEPPMSCPPPRPTRPQRRSWERFSQAEAISRESVSVCGKLDRATICVSSQVGCAVNCRFCLTALLGVKRSLTAGEIVGQVLAVLEERRGKVEGGEAEGGRPAQQANTGLAGSPGRSRLNLVFMGMGEPFLNYDAFMQAVRLLVEGVGIAEMRMTVSTAGIVPRIYQFGAEPVRPKLAISLNASNDEMRDRLMPINRKWNLDKLIAAAHDFPLRPRERLTFEYVLLDGVNDAAPQAREVAARLRGLRAKVNLIALNPGPEIAFRTPHPEQVLRFQSLLVDAGIPTFIRQPRGRDIFAACGQLKKTVSLDPSGDPAI